MTDNLEHIREQIKKDLREYKNCIFRGLSTKEGYYCRVTFNTDCGHQSCDSFMTQVGLRWRCGYER